MATGRLRELIAKWRRIANGKADLRFHSEYRDAVEACADELEALAESGAASEVKMKEKEVPMYDNDPKSLPGKQQPGAASGKQTREVPQRHELSITIEGAEQVATVMEALRKAGFHAVKSIYSTPLAKAGETSGGQRFDAELFYAQLIDGQIIKESDGEPWPLTKPEARQICDALKQRLAAPAAPELSAEQFWNALWGEEAFALKDWMPKYAGVDCVMTPSRFNEALERLNALLRASQAGSKVEEDGK